MVAGWINRHFEGFLREVPFERERRICGRNWHTTQGEKEIARQHW